MIYKMKNAQITEAGFRELNEAEMLAINGGSWFRLIEVVALSALNNWQDLRQGFQDGINGQSYRYQ